MDRNTVIGFVLIGIILMIWMYMNAPPPTKVPPGAESTAVHITRPETSITRQALPGNERPGGDTLGKYFSHLASGQIKTLRIETKYYQAEISTRGGAIQSWELKDFKTWDKYPVNLIDGTDTRDFNLMFYTSDGRLVNTKNLVFRSDFQESGTVPLGENDSIRIDLVLPVDQRSRIVKSLVFYGGLYSFDAVYRFEN